MKTRWLWMAGVLLFCGCGRQHGQDEVDVNRKPSAAKAARTVEPRLVSGYNAFGFALLHQLAKEDEGKSNLVFSPLSVSFALSMVENGAAGATEKAITKMLNLGTLSLDEINRANVALQYNLQSTVPNVETRVANSLWAREGIDFDKEFLARCSKYYDAKATVLDLSTPAAVGAINSWVAEKTNGKITQLADQPYDPQILLVLLNAIYFKGEWQDKFEKSQTKDSDFHLQNGQTARVPMMNRDGEYSYVQNRSFSAVQLPYGEGDMGLYVLLPNRNVSLDSVMADLSAKSWANLQSQMAPREGHVSIPRFKLEYDTSLNQALSTLGIAPAFSPHADFSRMTKAGPTFLSEVRHKAIIEVNEEGTEAAAVTGGLVAGSAPAEPFEFVADRPFFAALGDNRTGSLLFFVVVRNPQ